MSDNSLFVFVLQFLTLAAAVFVGTVAANKVSGRRTGETMPTRTNDQPSPAATALTMTDVTSEPIVDDAAMPGILVDTSAIIDGRIADIAHAGFIPGRLVVPRFVLAELQNIADSDDAMRRGRGRRGLEVLNRLRETDGITVEVTDEDVSSIKEVDAKLVALAQRHEINVLTTDYNLNRVAAIQGVRVLNVNELSNAIRPVVLPGEDLVVRIVQPGKERNQGVGYLADGTMIVVEDGDKMIGQEVSTEVTRVFQTVAGKMIFAVPRNASGETKAQAKAKAAEAAVVTVPETAVAEPAVTPDADTKPAGNGRSRGRRGGRGRGSSSPTGRLEDRIIAATSDEPKA